MSIVGAVLSAFFDLRPARNFDMYALIFLACGVIGAGGPESKSTEIKVERWFNAPTLRTPENRTYVILFFSTLQAAETRPYLEVLEKLRQRRDVLVLALSAESASRVERFVGEEKIGLPVGARSRLHKQLKVPRFPAVVVLDPKPKEVQATPEIIHDVARVNDFLNDFAGESEAPSGQFDKSSTLAVLKHHARQDPDAEQRGRALELLRGRLEPKAFMKLCDELLTSAEGTSERGSISYLKHLADPAVPEKEALLAPSSVAANAMRDNPDDPIWEPVRQYAANIEWLSPNELMRDYSQHDGDSPDESLVRREIALQIGKLADKAQARGMFMQMLPGEKDAGVRAYIVGEFWTSCEIGDIEAAEFLETQLAKEPNVRVVRPLMEVAIQCLRTGEGPCE